MDQGTVGRIEGWDASPISGGYDGLRELAAADFSGAVLAQGAWLFMLNGRVVGVSGGSLEGFEDADGTAYKAPHPSLPLLFAMRDRGGETRARYYTDDTPLAEVDRTLSEGGFTGYIELSENVLSGDYYVIYYGGQSLSAAIIGSENRLITGDEAFERANDEVGIYEVRTVDLDVRDVPEPATTQTSPTQSSGAGDSGGIEHVETVDDEAREQGSGDDRRESPSTASSEETPSEPGAASEATSEEAESASTERSSTDPNRVSGAAADETATEETTADAGTPSEPHGETDDGGVTEGDSGRRRDTADASSAMREDLPDEDPFSEEEEWREARTIPTLDPEESESPLSGDASEEKREPEARSTDEEERPSQARQPGAERVEELRSAIESYEARIADLEQQLENATTERDRIREERDRLRQRVRDLEAGGDADGSDQAGSHLDPAEALARTDVFVRYGSKGQATLDTARTGETPREEVNENLRLETHTRFDDGSTAVDGQPFEEFLEETLEHRFVRWVVEDLLYEIGDTGNEGGLRDLFDAIPRIDRIEFRGSITSRDEEGEEQREPFDVIFRDRMGSPLIVADLNDARDPATDDTLSDLVERATTVADLQESLGTAFMVTASFFEPAALESASDATDAGFLNRDARKSFVKLSRKRGYHLCLVEARADEFHVAVPEL